MSVLVTVRNKLSLEFKKNGVFPYIWLEVTIDFIFFVFQSPIDIAPYQLIILAPVSWMWLVLIYCEKKVLLAGWWLMTGADLVREKSTVVGCQQNRMNASHYR